MRVYTRVAVPWKVLARRNHPVALKPSDKSSAKTSDESRILAIRSRVDYRIGRIVIDIEDRRVSNVDSDCPAFLSSKLPLLEGQRGIPRCANRHLGRRYHSATKVDCIRNEVATTGPKSGAGFQIRPKQHRNSAH